MKTDMLTQRGDKSEGHAGAREIFRTPELRRLLGPKRVLAGVALAGIIAAMWYLRRSGTFDPVLLQDFAATHAVTAPIVMLAVYAIVVMSGLPALPLNLAAGVFWGPIVGGLISTVGATIGAVAAFSAARSIFGKPLANHVETRLVAQLQTEFEEKGWCFVAFIRLNPIIPTGPLNYILGLTSIDTFTYVWTTFAFLLLPGTAVAFIGYHVGTFVVEGQVADFVKLILAISAGVTILAALAYGARIANRRSQTGDRHSLNATDGAE
jgi:uncharacterized membrane protein YdjX (TVP38/TMEM64 family)